MPFDQRLSYILVPGGAFRMQYAFGTEPGKSRLFFILNKDPLRDAMLVIATVTSQIEKRRNVRPPSVLVEIGPQDYDGLDRPSVIDCDSLQVWPRERVLAAIRYRSTEPLRPLPPQVLSALKKAVMSSFTISEAVKRLVC